MKIFYSKLSNSIKFHSFVKKYDLTLPITFNEQELELEKVAELVPEKNRITGWKEKVTTTKDNIRYIKWSKFLIVDLIPLTMKIDMLDSLKRLLDFDLPAHPELNIEFKMS